MNWKSAKSALLALGLIALANQPGFCQDNVDLTGVKPQISLKGLSEARLVINVTNDAKHWLHSILQRTGVAEEKIQKAVTDKAKLLPALKLDPSSGPPGKSQILFLIATDFGTGEFTVVMSVQELVNLSREPHTEMWLTTWERRHRPTSNEAGPIGDAAGILMDEFIADYLSANPAH